MGDQNLCYCMQISNMSYISSSNSFIYNSSALVIFVIFCGTSKIKLHCEVTCFTDISRLCLKLFITWMGYMLRVIFESGCYKYSWHCIYKTFMKDVKNHNSLQALLCSMIRIIKNIIFRLQLGNLCSVCG